ncbi:MAG TPA: NAD(P)-binding protein [Dietzia timorensis]|uniref:NAD(P)-binding protein n=1 Tax=Dietzia timorensis TaxID=499555 RepID=A0A921F298_9ACTN|nr:styrene monooxygenase/indole monooxygenase family protein [Dietzia timorensis]HJE90015.1 NAD(P)-binding protein [Dietzia timorensis]
MTQHPSTHGPSETPGNEATPRRSIAIVGAGIVGASAALALKRAGFDVTLYSERTREELRDAVPATGTAILFGDSRSHDARIEGDRYGADAAFATSAVTVNGGPTFDAPYDYEAQSVDVRLRADDRIGLFLDEGGSFAHRRVDDAELDRIAGENDVTFVATGKGGLAERFPVDAERSPYSEPQRYLLTVTVRPADGGDVRFPGRTENERSALLSIDAEEGEVFVGPYLHKDAGPAWVLLGFARFGSESEKAYREARDSASALDIFRAQHHRLFPDVAPQIDALEVIDSDEYSWLKGAVTPTVRRPVARTDSGGLLVSLGDTAIAVDPIAGQGAQLGAIQVAALADALREQPGEWDEELFTRLFDTHWERHGKPSVEATSLFLGDPKYAEVVGSFFGRAAENPAAGTALFDLLSVPGPVLGLRGEEDVVRFVRTFEGRRTAVPAASPQVTASTHV